MNREKKIEFTSNQKLRIPFNVYLMSYNLETVFAMTSYLRSCLYEIGARDIIIMIIIIKSLFN